MLELKFCNSRKYRNWMKELLFLSCSENSVFCLYVKLRALLKTESIWAAHIVNFQHFCVPLVPLNRFLGVDLRRLRYHYFPVTLPWLDDWAQMYYTCSFPCSPNIQRLRNFLIELDWQFEALDQKFQIASYKSHLAILPRYKCHF